MLIASWLEDGLVERIRAAEPERVEVIFEPALLPPPLFRGDHHGPSRVLADGQLRHWRAQVARAEVMFDFDWESGDRLLERAPALRWLQATSSGIGPLLERLGFPKAGVRVTNAAGIHAQPLAEFALLAILHFAKEMPRLQRWQKDHRWEKYCAREVAGSRLLVVGLGQVGRRVAELGAAVGMEVVGVRQAVHQALPSGVSRVAGPEQLDAELAQADFVVLIAPATAGTTHLLDRRRLALLNPQAVIVNIGRGSLIEEPALIEALRDGRLAGAALDVFATEPLPSESPLWDLENVIVAPHSVSTVELENERLVDLFLRNLRLYLEGSPLLNEFDHRRGY